MAITTYRNYKPEGTMDHLTQYRRQPERCSTASCENRAYVRLEAFPLTRAKASTSRCYCRGCWKKLTDSVDFNMQRLEPN